MILATVDIEDLATPKLAAVRSALDETATAMRSFAANNPQVAQAAQVAQQVGSSMAQQAQRVATLTQNYQEHARTTRQVAAASQEAANSYNQVTKASAGLLASTGKLTVAQRELAKAVHTVATTGNKDLIQFINRAAGTMGNLAQDVSPGIQVTRQMSQSVTNLAKATQQMGLAAGPLNGTMRTLIQTFKPGQTVTKHMYEAFQEANKSIQTYNGLVPQMSNSTQASTLSMAALAAALGTVTAGLGSYLSAATDVAARNEVLGTVMGVVAKNSANSSVELQAQVEVIKSMGVTTQAATETIIDFAQANLNVADASKLARVAQDLGVIAGKSSAETVAMLTKAIQTQNIQTLRQFGIVKSLGPVLGAYAQDLGKTAKELTGVERQQAVLNLILEEGAQVAGTFEASMQNVGKQQVMLAVYSEELSNKIGKSLLPAKMKLVQVQTELYKSAMNLPDSFIAIATAAGVAVTAVTGFMTVITGAKLAGIGTLLAPLGGMLTQIAGAFKVAGFSATAFSTAGAAVTAALGPVGIAVGVVAAALAVLAGAYVYVTAKQQEFIDKGKQDIVDWAERKANVDNYVKTLQQFQKTAAVTESEKIRLKEAVEALNRLMPGAVEWVNKETGAFKLNTKAVQDNTAELERNAEERIKLARMEIAELRQKVTQEEQMAARSRTIADSNRSLAGVGGNVGAYAGAAGRDANAELMRARIKGLEEQIKSAEELTTSGRATRARDALREARSELEASLDPGQNFDQVLARVARADKAGKELVEKIKGVDKKILDALARKDFDAVPQGANVKSLFTALGERFEQLTAEDAKKAEKAGDKYAAALKSMRDRIAGETVEMRAQAQALNEEVSRILNIKNPETQGREWERFVQRFGGQTKTLGLAIDDLAEDAPKLAQALQEIQSAEVFKWVEQMADEVQNSIEAVMAASSDIVNKMNVDLGKQVRESTKGIKEERIAVNRQIFESDRELYEQQVVAYMNAEDQIRYAEQKRMADLEYRHAEEARLREKAFDDQIEAVNETIAAAKRESNEMIRNVRLRMTARINEAVLAKALSGEISVAQAQQYAKEMEMLADHLTARLDAQRNANLEEIEQDGNAAIARIEANRKAGQQITADQKAALERQRQQGERNVQQQIATYKMLNQAVRTVFVSMASGMADAFKGMLTQTMGFKEAFMQVWRSILSGVTSIFSTMVERWIGNMQRMSSKQNGGFDMGGFFRGMFGMGPKGASSGMAGGSWGQGAGAYGQMLMGGGYGTVGAGFGAGASRGSIAGIDGMAASGAGLAGKGGLWAGKTGFASSGLGAAAMGVGAGAIVGGMVASRYADGSYVKGIGSGAASGAAAGAAVGGWWGAAAGAVGGGIAGWFQARKQRKQMDEDRKAIIEQAGGIEQLKQKAEEAGISIDTMLKTKSVKEFQKEINKMDAAFTKLEKDQLIAAQGGSEAFLAAARSAGTFDEATLQAFTNGTLSAERMGAMLEKLKKDLELKEAKDGLAKTASAMDALRKQAVLAGFDLKKLYDAKSVEEFNAQQSAFNKLLEQQQNRLNGLATAAQGFGLRVTGLVAEYGKDLDAFTKGLSSEQQKAWKDLVEQSKEGGKSLVQQLREASSLRSGLGGGARVGDLELSGKQGEELSRILNNVQQGIAKIGGQAGRIFGGILRETGDLGAAFEAINEPLDQLQQLMDETGATAPQALHHLLEFRKAAEANKDVVASLGGITMMLKGLGDAGQLTAQAFNELGADANDQWAKLRERHVAEDQALLMMQPTLQALYEAQKNFGLATDETTQNLINMGVEQGLVGDQFQSINQKMLDMLMIIAEAVGGTIPEAYRKQTEAAQAAATATTAAGDAVAGGANAGADAMEQLNLQAQVARQELERLNDADLSALEEKIATAGEVLSDDVQESVDGAKDKLRIMNETPLDSVKNEAENVASAVDSIDNATRSATDAILRMVDETRGPLAEMEENVGAISLGRSPGGLKEIRIKSMEGMDAIRLLGRDVIDNALAMERAVNQFGTSFGQATDLDTDLGNPFAMSVQPPNTAPPLTPAQQREAAEPPVEQAPTNVFVTLPPVTANIQSLDPSKVADIWNAQIRPMLAKDLEANVGQITTQLGRATRRYAPAGPSGGRR